MSTNTNAPTHTLLETAAANGSFKTFGAAVEHAGLTDTLKGAGPFTVFAPTDAAFEKLPAGTLDELLKPENKAQLAGILNYHVIAGRKSANDIGKWGSARMANGQSAPIKNADGKVSIDGAFVINPDIATSNGVIHAIDKVNLPAAAATAAPAALASVK
ncbi:MAG: fasciclin domain-containing protein [Silanimonas sp.]